MANVRADAEGEARAAVERLVAAHGCALYALGRRICDSPEEAEEMVQETFLNAFRGWAAFEGRSKAKTWLYTIARRVCMRMHRPRAGEPAELEPLEALLPGGPEDTVADLAPDDPHREHLRREAQATVDRALRELPLDFRVPLILVDIAELSIAETAEVLGVPRNTVKTRVHRARLKLRKAIDEGLPQKRAPRSQPAEVCFALLQAKLSALDREAQFPYPDAAVCERCASVFAALDLSHEACVTIGRGELPPALVERLTAALADVG